MNTKIMGKPGKTWDKTGKTWDKTGGGRNPLFVLTKESRDKLVQNRKKTVLFCF